MQLMKKQLAGHRGVARLAPENTLAGIRKAAELNIPWVEFDTQLSKDGIPMVIHDATVDRCSNGHGKVADMTLAQLQALDAGCWFAPEFANEPLPTLEQALRLCQSLGLQVNLELKLHRGDDAQMLCEGSAAIIEKINFAANNLLISSFDSQAMQFIHQRLPQIRRGQLWEVVPENWQMQLEAMKAYSAHCNAKYLTEPQVQAIKAAGYRVITYTTNDPKSAQKLSDWGVDLIISDCPQAL
jgi:glycerophosphoryl diester phosphodiesterase